MADEYTDLYIRDNFGDDGSVPSPDNPYASPDIIPLQTGTLSYQDASASYDVPTDLGKPILSPGVNNIFVRARNLGTTASSGTVGVSYSPSNLFLLPNTWTPIQTALGAGSVALVDGTGATSIAAKGIAISQSAFVLTNLGAGVHYCLISVIQTPTHPVVVPPTFGSNSEMVQWVQNNPAVGWRNINVVPNPRQVLIVTHGFSSINAADWAFECSGSGFETGVNVTIQCTDVRCPFEDSKPLPPPDPTGAQKVMFEAFIPANITNGAVVVTLTANTQPMPKNARLKVRPYQVPDSSIDLDFAVASSFAVAPDYHRAALDGTATLIQLGEVTTILGDPVT